MRLLAFVLLAGTVLAPALSHASAIAVMPFRDLSGGKGSIGEAIRETVTSDLKEVSGMKVIERSNLDKVLLEQNLQSKKDDLDPMTSVKVGKLVGASLLVTGAYQKVANNVRLTARFVSVETGEIVGTAKVDGAQTDFLTLQDRITTQLLKSAGIEGKKVQLFAARQRPKVRSIRTIELYGDAVLEPDDQKRKVLLTEAVKIDPGFVYASRDLDALEKRIREYASIAQGAQDKQMQAELARIDTMIANEKDPTKLYTYYLTLFANLMQQGRYRTLIVLSHKVQEHPLVLPPSFANAPQIDEQAQMWIFRAYEALKDDDNMLREGEKYMAKYPTASGFTTVQMLMNVAIDRKRDRDEGAAAAEAEFKSWTPKERANPCRTGPIYHSHKQDVKARAAMEACAKAPDPSMPWFSAFMLVLINYDLGDFKQSRKWLEVMRTQYPEKYRDVRHFETMMPREQQ